MSILSRCALLTASVLLAACGGGGGGGAGGGAGNVRPDLGSSALASWLPVNAGTARTLTRSAAPAETAAEQATRGNAIRARADSIFVSSAHQVNRGDGSISNVPITCTGGPMCVGVADPSAQQDISTVVEALSDVEETVLTKNGITLGQGAHQITDGHIWVYGGWMNHAGFGIWNWLNRTHNIVDGNVVGDLTGSAPGGSSLRWSGLMVGAVRSASPLESDPLQGDAALSWDGSDLDATFSSIRNLRLQRAHTTPTVTFTGMSVNAQGIFSDGSRGGNRIQGAFYGPDHAEAAGIVETADLVGAFGAKKR